MQPAMLTEHFAFEIHDGARLIRHEGAEEIFHLHFADEANALAVLFLRRFQIQITRDGTQLWLQEMADGKSRDLNLLLDAGGRAAAYSMISGQTVWKNWPSGLSVRS